MRQQHYGPVPLHDKDDDEHDNSEDLLLQRRSNSRSWPKLIWHGLALCSIIVNLVFLPILLSESSSCQAKSQYAGLVLGSERSAWKFRSEWYSRNRTSSDALWDAISFDAGMIALNDEEAAAMGLPLSERFPWDQNKGIYLVNAYHNLHCLKYLWRSLARFRDGEPFSYSDWHSFHCVDSLRQDTICNADDTPRYGGGEQSESSTGTGQVRHCSSWDQLEAWVVERSACYRYLRDDVEDTLDQYKFCPDGFTEGERYNQRIAKLFGEGEWTRLREVYGDAAEI